MSILGRHKTILKNIYNLLSIIIPFNVKIRLWCIILNSIGVQYIYMYAFIEILVIF